MRWSLEANRSSTVSVGTRRSSSVKAALSLKRGAKFEAWSRSSLRVRVLPAESALVVIITDSETGELAVGALSKLQVTCFALVYQAGGRGFNAGPMVLAAGRKGNLGRE
jgi:hypothetical protein